MKTHQIISSLTLLLFVLITADSLSQQLLYEQNSNGLRDFNATAIGDSILFSYDEFTGNAWIRNSKWITDSAVSNLSSALDASMAATFGNELYLYALDGKSKSRTLKAVTLDLQSKTSKESNSSLPLSGTLLGNYVDKNLFLLLLQDKGRTLSVVEIHKMEILKEIRFNLPINVSPYLWEEFSGDLFSEPTALNSFKGRSKAKIFKSDKIYMTLDVRDPSATPWETWVLVLDPHTQSVNYSKFKDKTNAIFSSFILDDKLFRILNDRKSFIVEIYDLKSQRLIVKSQVPGEKDFPVYFRYGRKNDINKSELFSHMQKVSRMCEPSLVVHKIDEHYLLQWGTYFNENGVIGGSATPAGLVSMIVGNIIFQAMEGPGINRYFYYEWNSSDNTFGVREPGAKLVREKIDNYEISNDKAGKTYKHKGYVKYKTGLVGIYYDNKKNLSLVYFH